MPDYKRVINISANCFDGKIIKAVGGIYYVDILSGVNKGEIVRCAARGIFRLDGISPSAGDFVTVTLADSAEPLIAEIKPRRNFLIRPPLANLDGIVFVNSIVEPVPNRFVLDKLVAIADNKGIEPYIVLTKIDLKDAGDLLDTYRSIGIGACLVNNLTGEGSAEVLKFIEGKTTAFVGNSGVGKSSLLNALFPQLTLETAVTSKKLGRGRHTTRQVEMYKLAGGYVADTPGFSTVDTERYCKIPKEEIDISFREFAPFSAKCKFTNCAHGREQGCEVRAAVERGEIAKSRYESFQRLYKEAAERNQWE